MQPLALTSFTATSCLGSGLDATLAALRARRTGLAPCNFETVTLDAHVGEVPGVDAVSLPADLHTYDCRNNRLAHLALAQDGFADAVRRCAASLGSARVGVFLGTSTSGILETELAYRRRDPASGALPADFRYRGAHNTFSLAAFVRAALQLAGPAAVISSACSSSAKVFASARRAIEADLIDAAVVGGVDSLCLTTLYGFHSLQLVSRQPCRPFDAARDGISIGEAAAFALLERRDAGEPLVELVGTGESSDAYHMSSPHPQGRGARAAMLEALRSAALAPAAIDYINFHGTGTPSNDESEACAVAAVLGSEVPGSSTKGATGHTLGAAGALEAVICALALRHEFMPGGVNTATVDPALKVNYLRENVPARLRRVMSNSFGFGGSNCSLIFAQPGRTL
ncbi:MAG TPA: beta-ketoacyl-[acyl-carrier-protein] synthase family protein [Steroidobacteraceae bacterium]|jgi:3-oxoacyl-[acyl-carrier-protein] synthase-1|nr:beta-ketoacyl-[acyl-carrier-protein] synthase family protein [Steroidobacteraceae bacterium]